MKIKYNKILFIGLLVTATMFSACNKEQFDINSNPDDVTETNVTPSVLLPGALQQTASTIASEFWFLEWWLGHGARSGSYQSFTEEETYTFTNDFHVAIWNQLYANTNTYNLMVNRASAAGQGIYEASGRIMRSHNFLILTDIYGNIPYSEAFFGTAKPTPKYDKSIDVYKGILADLDAAVAVLQDHDKTAVSANPDIATADIAFKGDATMWLKLANTLRLRLLMHLQNGIETTTTAPGIDVAAQMAKITSEGCLGVGESFAINPGFNSSKPAPYYRFWSTNESGAGSQRDWARANAYAIDYYGYNSDPRRSRFYVPAAAGHVGIEFGTPSGPSAPIGSDLSTVRGPGYTPNGAASKAYIITSAESFFLQAEAAQRGLRSGNAKALLNQGITESFTMLGLTAAQATSYINVNATYADVDIEADPLGPGKHGGGLFTIFSQKWFALNMLAPFELWTDYRRSDIVLGESVDFDPGPPISVDPANIKTKIPIRLFYPQNEYNYNAANVSAEGTLDVFTSKLFWDLN